MIPLPTEVGKKLLNLHAEVGQFFCLKAAHIITIARPLTIAETEAIEELDKLIPIHSVHDWVCEKAIVFASCGLEQLLHTERAGLVKALAETIIRRSTITDHKEFLSKLNTSRERHEGLDKSLDTVIADCLHIQNTKGVSIDRYIDYIARAEIIKGKKLIEEVSQKPGRKQRGGPRVPDGFNSAEVGYLSKDSAHVVSPDIIDKDIQEFKQNA